MLGFLGVVLGKLLICYGVAAGVICKTRNGDDGGIRAGWGSGESKGD